MTPAVVLRAAAQATRRGTLLAFMLEHAPDGRDVVAAAWRRCGDPGALLEALVAAGRIPGDLSQPLTDALTAAGARLIFDIVVDYETGRVTAVTYRRGRGARMRWCGVIRQHATLTLADLRRAPVTP